MDLRTGSLWPMESESAGIGLTGGQFAASEIYLPEITCQHSKIKTIEDFCSPIRLKSLGLGCQSLCTFF